MFKRILVAMDGSEAARDAFVFVSDWARHFDAQVWFIQLTNESSRRRCGIATDVAHRGRLLANQFTVSGATRGARNQQLVNGIAEAAQTFRADLIVMGLDRQRLASGVRDQLTELTDVSVLIAPKRVVRPVPATTCPIRPIALGPAPSRMPAMAGAGQLAHV